MEYFRPKDDEYPDVHHAITHNMTLFITEAHLPYPTELSMTTETYEGSHNENVVLTYIDYICIAWFTLEYFIRLWATPRRWDFLKSPMNIIDLLAFLPFYVSMVLLLFHLDAQRFRGLSRAVKTFRVMRVLRVLKLARHSAGLQVLNIIFHA